MLVFILVVILVFILIVFILVFILVLILIVFIRSQERAIAKELWRHLIPSLNETTAPLITRTIKLLAERMPLLVGDLLVDTRATMTPEPRVHLDYA